MKDENIEVIKISQNISLVTVIKSITNIEANMEPLNILLKSGEIQEVDYVIDKEKGTEYKVSYTKKDPKTKQQATMKIGILFKDFFPTEEQKYPLISDKHLKMLLYILSKDEDIFTFYATEFNQLCNIRARHNKNINTSYKVLKDLLNIEIRFMEDEEEIDLKINEQYEYHPLLKVLKRRDKISNIKVTNENSQIAAITKKTMSRALIEIGVGFGELGQMYIPKNLFKIRIDKNNLGATSILYNLCYLEAIKNNKKSNTSTYNISTILSWIGITEDKYYEFYEKNTNLGYKYFENKIKKILLNLADCGVSFNLKPSNIKNIHEFYNKQQVIFDLTKFKKSI